MLNTKKLFTKILTGLVPMDAFVITNVSINWGGNNYVSVPSSAVPTGSYALVCAYNGGFQNNPRWITSHAYQNGTWVLHSDTAVSDSIATTLVWIKTTYFL